MLLKRTLVALVLIALLCVVLAFGGWFQCAIISLATLLSIYEIKNAFIKEGEGIFVFPAYAFAALYYVVYKLYGMELMFALWAAAVLAVITERVLNGKRTTAAALKSLALLVYPSALYVILMLLAEYDGFALSRTMFFAAFAMPLVGDTFAYFVGRAIGKHKLCPELSPNKTVEGSVAGLLGGVAGGALTYALDVLVFGGDAPLFVLLPLGLVCGAMGQIGDLFASALKRYAGIKDFGWIFPGHGGMTDRLDSVLTSAPIIYAAFMLWPH